MKSEQLKGHLDLLVLGVLSGGRLHGYAVIEELRRRSGGRFDLPQGTVYPVLHRLEATGLLASEWIQVSGRRRRCYALTDRGRVALGEEHSSWQGFSAAIASTLRGVSWPKTT